MDACNQHEPFYNYYREGDTAAIAHACKCGYLASCSRTNIHAGGAITLSYEKAHTWFCMQAVNSGACAAPRDSAAAMSPSASPTWHEIFPKYCCIIRNRPSVIIINPPTIKLFSVND